MNTTIIGLVSLMLTFISLTAGAQNSIKSAFEAIKKCPEAKVKEYTSLDKDPSTGRKTGQCEGYWFEVPLSEEKLIKDVFSAFENEADKAYSFTRGGFSEDQYFAIGDGSSRTNLYYFDGKCVSSLFLAPLSEDPDGIYRYAYGLSYKEKDGKFKGKFFITYAMTLKQRQQLEQKKQNEVIRKWSNGTYDNGSGTQKNAGKTWFDQIMSYLQVMSSSSTETRIALASKIYKVVRDTPKYSDVTEADKETVREILKGMIDDMKYSETVLNTLLKQCLESIK